MVAERGMQSLVVVSNFKEGCQIGAHCVEVAPALAAHLLLFESLHQRLGLSVVVRITHAAHARLHTVLGQQRKIVGAWQPGDRRDVPKLLVILLDSVLPVSRLPVSVGDGQDSNH